MVYYIYSRAILRKTIKKIMNFTFRMGRPGQNQLDTERRAKSKEKKMKKLYLGAKKTPIIEKIKIFFQKKIKVFY